MSAKTFVIFVCFCEEHCIPTWLMLLQRIYEDNFYSFICKCFEYLVVSSLGGIRDITRSTFSKPFIFNHGQMCAFFF